MDIASTNQDVKISYSDRLQFLQQVPIFQAVTNRELLSHLATCLDEVEFPADSLIFSHGQEGHLLYILVSGQVKVHLDDLQLTQLEPVAYFGEMALLGSQPRSASVTTLKPSQCLILTQDQVYQAIAAHPSIALKIIQVLCQRVRTLNRLFGASEDLFYNLVKKQIL